MFFKNSGAAFKLSFLLLKLQEKAYVPYIVAFGRRFRIGLQLMKLLQLTFSSLRI